MFIKNFDKTSKQDGPKDVTRPPRSGLRQTVDLVLAPDSPSFHCNKAFQALPKTSGPDGLIYRQQAGMNSTPIQKDMYWVFQNHMAGFQPALWLYMIPSAMPWAVIQQAFGLTFVLGGNDRKPYG